MSKSTAFDQLVKEIKLYIRYAVPESEIERAAALVERYRKNRRILALLREYYVALPDAREEPVLRISKLLQRQGVVLYVLTTTSTAQIYAVSVDEIVWLGEYPGALDPEISGLWGFADHAEFLKICVPVGDLEDLAVVAGETGRECPICGVEAGEYHILGCSVEVCPWCEGQLNKCNCRFEQLEVDLFESDEHLERFLDILHAKGRIPFEEQQAPFYPGTSDGLDREREEQ
jgi:hypothetical protein